MIIPSDLPNTAALVWMFTLFSKGSSCEQMTLSPRILGAGCAWDNAMTVLTVEEHECVLGCFTHKTCKAINYDVQSKACTRSETPCPVVEPQPNVNYQILATVPVDECVQWVATHDWNYPRIVKVNREVITGNYPLGVARFVSGGDLLPAKWPDNNANVYTIKSGGVAFTSAFEVLVVKETWSLRWVYFDASSSDPLPTGAIQGGQWSDGTPLYVALVYARADKHVIGYYNHATRIATCDYFGTNNLKNLELLVVAWINHESNVHGAYMEPTWGRQDPGRPHVGPMILAIWEGYKHAKTVPSENIKWPVINCFELLLTLLCAG